MIPAVNECGYLKILKRQLVPKWGGSLFCSLLQGVERVENYLGKLKIS